MEEFLKQQKTEIDELDRLIRNFKKDGEERKTIRYLKDKKAPWPELFKLIKDVDEKIQPLREAKYESQPYFADGTFQKISIAYENAMRDIEKRLQSLSINSTPQITPSSLSNGSGGGPSQSTGPVSQSQSINAQQQQKSSNESMDTTSNLKNDSLERANDDSNGTDAGKDANGGTDGPTADSGEQSLLNILYNELMDCIAAARGLNDDTSNGFIEANKNNLNAIWNEFRSSYLRERATNKTIEFSYSSVQQKYMKVIGELNDKSQIDKKNARTVDNQFSLPKLRLHEFNGRILEWKSFIANFDRMIHNNKSIDDGRE